MNEQSKDEMKGSNHWRRIVIVSLGNCQSHKALSFCY